VRAENIFFQSIEENLKSSSMLFTEKHTKAPFPPAQSVTSFINRSRFDEYQPKVWRCEKLCGKQEKLLKIRNNFQKSTKNSINLCTHQLIQIKFRDRKRKIMPHARTHTHTQLKNCFWLRKEDFHTKI